MLGGGSLAKLLQDISIGSKIAKLRKEAGLTQLEMIAKMQIMGSNISRTGFVKIENGYRNIKISDLMIMKAILAKSYDELFDKYSVDGD